MQLMHTPQISHSHTQSITLGQHQRIADDLEQLAQSIDGSHEKEATIRALGDLTALILAHFQHQEAAWDTGSARERGWHRDAHRFVLEYLQRMNNDAERLDRDQMLLRLSFVRHWLTAHFRTEDFEPG